MNLQEIKTAVDNGLTVHWANEGCKVIKDSKNRYLIIHDSGYCIGLTWQDGLTLNGKEDQFYIGNASH